MHSDFDFFVGFGFINVGIQRISRCLIKYVVMEQEAQRTGQKTENKKWE